MQTETAYLILLHNEEHKEIFPLSGGVASTIGRASENTVSLKDDRCSRYHAKVFYDDGQWFAQDLGSRNGTMVDDVAVVATTHELHPGCRIRIGRSALLFGCGEPQTEEINDPPPGNDDLTERTGIIGVSSELLRGPRQDKDRATEIVHQRGHTSILKPDADFKQSPRITTRAGHGPVELCRLAYNLGKTEEVDQVAKIAIEGLLKATGAEGAGLWLFPYNLKSTQSAADIRLVANATIEETQYSPISESLVRTVFDRKEAILFNESGKEDKNLKRRIRGMAGTDLGTRSTLRGGNNTMAAPIRYQNGILGLLHLYTVSPMKYLDEDDLEYTLAVADTVGVALAHVNKQKELAANLNQARKENVTLREMLQMNSEIIGQSQPIKAIHHLIARAAEARTSVLVRGESGVGKELIARAVHFASARKSKPLVCLNCAAISESLLASELFGHEKGSFTGATERKIGKFEAANTGTLFLDEIGEMSPSLQSKFLRVLEGHPFERVGGNAPVSVDVRVIAATNRDLEKEVTEGRFRYDLFFRLRVLEIVVPPLRKRVDDIPILADYFLDRYSKETGRKYQGLTPEAMRLLMVHRWPGNIRELKNVIERAVVLGAGPYVQEQDLLLSTLNTTGETDLRRDELRDVFIPLTLEDMERNHIIRTLEHVQWNKSLASKQLGIERTTLDRKIKRYDLERE